MPWLPAQILDDLLGSAAGEFLGDVGEVILGGVVANEGASKGAARDYRYYKKRDQYDWRVAQDRGLTPQEFYGSPAS